jgi:hypothetical protein
MAFNGWNGILKFGLKTENFKVKTPHRYKLWYSKTYTE